MIMEELTNNCCPLAVVVLKNNAKLNLKEVTLFGPPILSNKSQQTDRNFDSNRT